MKPLTIHPSSKGQRVIKKEDHQIVCPWGQEEQERKEKEGERDHRGPGRRVSERSGGLPETSSPWEVLSRGAGVR